MTERRLIEEAFPLKEVSEHSKHEKNVRHGHISTLHIWPARRPLAAARAAIIATLMPDPGDEASRHALNKKIASITKWKTENGPALDFFRQEIREAFGGRPPRVLDMFAGGGAIPLEAMRLGCDVTAIDYNPVAWFILKCTLEFPQRLAGKTWPLPQAEGKRKKTEPAGQMSLGITEPSGKQGDLADHVRYWGNWVLKQARAELEPYYPTVSDQPTVAYLWARTIPCPDHTCGTIVPLLKTMSLCKKEELQLPDTPENRTRPDFLRIKKTKNTSMVVINARRALRLIPPQKGEGGFVRFEVWTPDSNKVVPNGTMIGANSQCPCCGVNVSADYIKECGYAGKLDQQMTAVVIDTGFGKDYRLPTLQEIAATEKASHRLVSVAEQIPYGLPSEPLHWNPRTLGVQLYGLTKWTDLFTPRQMLALITFAKLTRTVKDKMAELGYEQEWVEAIVGYLASIFDRLADYSSTVAIWVGDFVGHTFTRFALPITWDFCEVNPISGRGGDYTSAVNWVVRVVEHLQIAANQAEPPAVLQQSATDPLGGEVDVVVTDPPYYQAIPYADLSDFFYVWLRRVIGDSYPRIFTESVTQKEKELALRLPHVDLKDRKTPEWYEAGMSRAFQRAWDVLSSNGRMVVVFAHKEPEAWETLVTAIIQAGFTVTASWPIDTERQMRIRSVNSAALASSIWLVCRKRAANASVGRYRTVRKAMEERITERLRYFWDIGLSGPDFVWAAIGPALESYSSYEEVKRLDGSPFTVSQFLSDVRRMVADFALGQILKGHSTEGLDEWTRYYLMHRNDFGLEPAPVGECILLSQGYGLDLDDLRRDRGLIQIASGSNVRLTKWDERIRTDLGEPHPTGGLPLIDALHRMVHLWHNGSLDQLNSYAAEKGLRQNDLFWAVAQAILEMAPAQSRERTLLEAIVAWGRGKTVAQEPEQLTIRGIE